MKMMSKQQLLLRPTKLLFLRHQNLSSSSSSSSSSFPNSSSYCSLSDVKSTLQTPPSTQSFFQDIRRNLNLTSSSSNSNNYFHFNHLSKLNVLPKLNNTPNPNHFFFNNNNNIFLRKKLCPEESKLDWFSLQQFTHRIANFNDNQTSYGFQNIKSQCFHPQNMSSAEKLRLELKNIRYQFKMSEPECGSACVQVAQLTTKIKHLSTKKDKHSRKGLQAMVQKRKKLLEHLRRTDWDSYSLVLSNLGLRDNPDTKA